MSRKKLMIMGAGIYQVPLIQKAREMGYSPIVVSIPGNYPGIALADKFYSFDTRDREQILETAMQEEISGICTSGTDVAIRTVGYVNSRMGLCGIPEDVAGLVTDKWLMKEAFVKNGVSTAAFQRVMSWEEARDAALEMGYPVMVKATDSSGSRGIRRACNEEELKAAYEEAKRVTRNAYVLVEEFIEAEEIGVDGYVGEDGEPVLFPHEKFNYTADGTTIPIGHKFPYHAGGELLEELDVQMRRAVRALRLKNCPLNADVFVKDNKVWIIEVGGRTGGTCIPELLTIHTGYNWYEKLIDAAVGNPVSFEGAKKTPCMAKLIFSPVADEIRAIDRERLEELSREGVDWHVDFEVGHAVNAMRSGPDRIGHLVAPVNQEKALNCFVSEMRDCIKLRDKTLEEVWREYERESNNHRSK